jgi:hypothetical protein
MHPDTAGQSRNRNQQERRPGQHILFHPPSPLSLFRILFSISLYPFLSWKAPGIDAGGRLVSEPRDLVSIRKHRMKNEQFPIRKGGIFRPGKKIKGLRGGVHRYAAQASPKIDAAWAEKNPFRTETKLAARPVP